MEKNEWVKIAWGGLDAPFNIDQFVSVLTVTSTL